MNKGLNVLIATGQIISSVAVCGVGCLISYCISEELNDPDNNENYSTTLLKSVAAGLIVGVGFWSTIDSVRSMVKIIKNN